MIKKKEAEEYSHDVEEGDGSKTRPSIANSFRNSEHLKVFTQAFTLTFLAEWGDRSVKTK